MGVLCSCIKSTLVHRFNPLFWDFSPFLLEAYRICRSLGLGYNLGKRGVFQTHPAQESHFNGELHGNMEQIQACYQQDMEGLTHYHEEITASYLQRQEHWQLPALFSANGKEISSHESKVKSRKQRWELKWTRVII